MVFPSGYKWCEKRRNQKKLEEIKYGNCDISNWEGSDINPYKELNGFWLDSSLKISPFEQVKVLAKIFEGESSYDKKSIEILKKLCWCKKMKKNKYMERLALVQMEKHGLSVLLNRVNKDNTLLYISMTVHKKSVLQVVLLKKLL